MWTKCFYLDILYYFILLQMFYYHPLSVFIQNILRVPTVEIIVFNEYIGKHL